MQKMKLTIIGMYNYDETLFDGLTLPEGYEKDLLVNEILMRSGEFDALYPSVPFMKTQISFWGRKHYRTFDKWIQALDIEYDPLNNYDRTEEYTDTHTGASSAKTEANYNEDKTLNLQDKRTADLNEKTTLDTVDTTEQIRDGETERQVSGYDVSTYSPAEKTTSDSGKSTIDKDGTIDLDTTGTDTTDHTGTDKTNIKGTLADTLSTENRTIKHEARLFGNIGVTTSQQMLQAELDVQRFNLYEQIADLFVEEFCIMVY